MHTYVLCAYRGHEVPFWGWCSVLQRTESADGSRLNLLTAGILECHSCPAICAFVLFVNRPTVISDGEVCSLF